MGEEGLEGVVEAAVPLVPVVGSGAGVEFAGNVAGFEQGRELAVRWEQTFLVATG